MFSFFKSRCNAHASNTRSRTRRRLRFEGLECRAMMSASPLRPAIEIHNSELEGLSPQETAEVRSLAAMGNVSAASGMTPPSAYVDSRGTLTIHGCKGNDKVIVGTNNQGQVTLTHRVNGVLLKDVGGKQIHQKPFQARVREIVFLGYNGNNEFCNNTSLPSKALGGAGVDKFFGGKGNDVFFGLGGNDVLEGRQGSDRLYGGTGHDILKAGSGTEAEKTTHNVLKGGKGHDKLFGSIGFDEMYGNSGNDKLRDHFGNGYLHGGKGNDVLFGLDQSSPGSRLQMHGGGGKNTLIVKPGIHSPRLGIPSPRLLTSNTYFDNDIFLPRNKSLKTLTLGEVNRLLS